MQQAQMRYVASPVICKKCGKVKKTTRVRTSSPPARNDSTELPMPKPYSKALTKHLTKTPQPGRDEIVRNAAGVPLGISTALARRGAEIGRAT